MGRKRFHSLVASLWLASLFGGASHVALGQVGTYLSTSQFLREGFGGTPGGGTYRLTAADQAAARTILGHSYAGSVRYWKSGNKTGWVLNKIGKHKPITAGFVVNGGKISLVRVLVYRESQGGEVKNTYFTRQFNGAKIGKAPRYNLSRRPGNISGATMSVNSMRKMSQFALYLHGKVAS